MHICISSMTHRTTFRQCSKCYAIHFGRRWFCSKWVCLFIGKGIFVIVTSSANGSLHRMDPSSFFIISKRVILLGEWIFFICKWVRFFFHLHYIYRSSSSAKGSCCFSSANGSLHPRRDQSSSSAKGSASSLRLQQDHLLLDNSPLGFKFL